MDKIQGENGMNNQKIPMIILSECVVFPGSSVYLNLYDSRSENAVSQAIGPGGKLVGVTRMPADPVHKAK